MNPLGRSGLIAGILAAATLSRLSDEPSIPVSEKDALDRAQRAINEREQREQRERSYLRRQRIHNGTSLLDKARRAKGRL